MPAPDVRVLVKKPIVLTGKIDVCADPHALHKGIKRGLRYPSQGAPPIFVPGAGAGLYRLRSAITNSVPSLEESLWEEAFVRLISQSESSHLATGSVRVGPDRNELSEGDIRRARSVLLTGVFRHASEDFEDGTFSNPRFGAVATLTVLPQEENKKFSDDAWINVEWVHSTGQMLRAISQIHGRSPCSGPVRNVKVVVAEHLWQQDADIKSQIEDLADLCGAKATVHYLKEATRGAILSDLSERQPAQLIVLGESLDPQIAGAFTRHRSERDLLFGSFVGTEALGEWLRTELPRLMGVGPALIPFPEVEASEGRPRMPVTLPAECAHHGANNYVRDGSDGVWWTRDHAQHGHDKPTVFKTYRREDNVLVWVGDHGASGELITRKHKGDEGLRIRLSETSKCSHPESHLK